MPMRVPDAQGNDSCEMEVCNDLPSDHEELLRLVRTAHPDDFPAWWFDAKLKLIQAGKGDEEVSKDDMPRPRKKRDRPSTGGSCSVGAGDGGARRYATSAEEA